MIKINLLATKEKPSAARGPQISLEGAKLTAMFVIILALGAAALVYDYYRLNAENERLQRAEIEQKQEKDRLARVKSELDQFEKRQQLLLKRLNIIETLRKNQSGPVSLLNTIASNVISAEQLWLTSFDNDGLKVKIDGVAGSVNTVADFIGSLKRSGQFKSVEINESFQDDRYKELTTFTFSISAELVPPAPAATGTPAAPGRTT